MKRGTSRGTEYPDPATPEAMALLNFSDIMDNKFPLGFFFFFFFVTRHSMSPNMWAIYW